jgi:hypothetical protein
MPVMFIESLNGGDSISGQARLAQRLRWEQQALYKNSPDFCGAIFSTFGMKYVK